MAKIIKAGESVGVRRYFQSIDFDVVALRPLITAWAVNQVYEDKSGAGALARLVTVVNTGFSWIYELLDGPVTKVLAVNRELTFMTGVPGEIPDFGQVKSLCKVNSDSVKGYGAGVYVLNFHRRGFYIGSSSNVTPRLHWHRSKLRHQDHPNYRIEGAAQGGHPFDIWYIETDTPLELEDVMLRALQGHPQSLNLNQAAIGVKAEDMMDISRARRSDSKTGMKHSAETRARMSTARKGRPMLETTKVALIAGSVRFHSGRAQSAEHRAARRESMIAHYCAKHGIDHEEYKRTRENKPPVTTGRSGNKPIMGEGVRYASIGEAGRALELNPASISRRITNANFPDWYIIGSEKDPGR